MPGTSKISAIFTDYCENTSLVGLSYISNRKIHFSERIFWLFCIIVSAGGSYYLIRGYQNAFESDAISLLMEGTRPQDKTEFIAIGVCQIASGQSARVAEFVKGLYEEKGRTDYSFDIEDFLFRIVFPNAYNRGGLQNYCSQFLDCADCVKCPSSGYEQIAEQVRMNCSELFINCSYNGKPFDCCEYFLPLQTPNGKCFLMNSIQATVRNGPHWLKTEFDWSIGNVELLLDLRSSVELHLLNSEDVPYHMMKDLVYIITGFGRRSDIQLSLRNIINDPGVRDVAPEYRKCRFPDENIANSSYDYYSYKACVLDCLKQLQLETCGCVSYYYLVNNNDKTPSCGYDGFLCLDRADILHPGPYIMQPWRSNGLTCICLPSCNDHEIRVFEESLPKIENKSIVQAKIRQSVSTEQFRRQAIRTRLDVVVTIGGVLGLFMGASILSGIEILYFFLIRIFNVRGTN